MAAISATELRQNLYNILDSVVDTGIPVEVERRGRLLRIVAEERGSKWDRLTPHQVVVGDPDDLVHIDWSHEWRGDRAHGSVPVRSTGQPCLTACTASHSRYSRGAGSGVPRPASRRRRSSGWSRSACGSVTGRR